MSESPIHNKLVKELSEHVKTKGFKITCSASLGLSECKEVNGHIPDLKGRNDKEDLNLYGEAKTKDDIDNDHTKSQIKAFGNRHMTSTKKDVPFYLAVPKGSKATAQKVLKDVNYDKKTNIHIVEF